MNENKRSILIVEDNYTNIEALSEILADEYELHIAKDGPDAIETATELLPDIILLDIVMQEMDGYEVLAILKKSNRTQKIPVIIITGLSNTDDERKGLMLGAADYITKPFSPAIVELRVKNQIKILEQLHTIEQLSMIDQLTGLPNRRSCDLRFNEEWDRAKREDSTISMLMIDIDRFKNYNDTYGHQQGDIALQEFATTVRHDLHRTIDFVGRWGGEEFMVLLSKTGVKGANEVAERIRKHIEEMEIPSLNEAASKITVSIGINTSKVDSADTSHDFFSGADKALYAAKISGRNRVRHFRE